MTSKQEKQIIRLTRTAVHMIMDTYTNKQRVNMWDSYTTITNECKSITSEVLASGVSSIRVPRYVHGVYFAAKESNED